MTVEGVRPRVWPVFVAFGVVLAGIPLLSTVVLMGWAWATMAPGAGVEGFVARLESFALSPPGLAAAALVSATILGGIALAAARLSPEPWRRRLRLSTAGATAARVALVVIGLLAVSQSLDSLVSLLGWSQVGAMAGINRVLARATGAWLALLVVAIALGPGIAEELFFRGFMQTRLAQRFGPASAVAITATCFGILHFDFVHTPLAAGLGVFLGWAVERTGTIVPAIAAHVVNNLVAVLTARWPLESPTVHAALLAAGVLVSAGAIVALRRVTQGDSR